MIDGATPDVMLGLTHEAAPAQEGITEVNSTEESPDLDAFRRLHRAVVQRIAFSVGQYSVEYLKHTIQLVADRTIPSHGAFTPWH